MIIVVSCLAQIISQLGPTFGLHGFYANVNSMHVYIYIYIYVYINMITNITLTNITLTNITRIVLYYLLIYLLPKLTGVKYYNQ